MTKIKCGDRCRDTLTGFEGIAIGITKYLHGCRHIGIKPTGLDNDGRPHKMEWFDEPQVERLKAAAFDPDGASTNPKRAERKGGPVPSGR